jgi:hypothetical protein
VILKRPERYIPDRKLGNFLVNAAQLIWAGGHLWYVFIFFPVLDSVLTSLES